MESFYIWLCRRGWAKLGLVVVECQDFVFTLCPILRAWAVFVVILVACPGMFFFFLFFDLRSTDSPTCFLPFAQKRIRTWSKQSYESYLVPFLPALRKALTHSFKQTGRFKHEESCLRFICFDVVSVSSRVVFKVYLQLFPGISGTHLRNLFDSGLDFPSGTNMKLKRLNPYWGLNREHRFGSRNCPDPHISALT